MKNEDIHVWTCAYIWNNTCNNVRTANINNFVTTLPLQYKRHLPSFCFLPSPGGADLHVLQRPVSPGLQPDRAGHLPRVEQRPTHLSLSWQPGVWDRLVLLQPLRHQGLQKRRYWHSLMFTRTQVLTQSTSFKNAAPDTVWCSHERRHWHSLMFTRTQVLTQSNVHKNAGTDTV